MVEPYLDVIGLIQYGTDIMFYCMALDSNFSLLIGSETLTKYMVHNNTVFPTTNYSDYILKRQDTLTQYITSYRFLLEKFDNIQVKRMLCYFISLTSLKLRLISDAHQTEKSKLCDVLEVFVNGLLIRKMEPIVISMVSIVPGKSIRTRLYYLFYRIFLKTLTLI